MRQLLVALALAALGWSMPVSAASAPDKAAPVSPAVLSIDPGPDLAHPGPVFEGWGTALAWFAHVTGGWPGAERDHLADLLYGPDGLRWNIARYNIGGGRSPDDPDYLRPGADVPGFWRRPAGATGKDWWRSGDPDMWDWGADANQRWWLDAVRQRVKRPIFEAFSNSPPYFMTISGRVTGNEQGTRNNLRPGYEAIFADYLADVVAQLQHRHHITFRTLSPINEPGTNYWHLTNTQEGSHWDPAAQARMIEASAAALHRKDLATVVSAPDETSSQLLLKDWAEYPDRVRRIIGQMNVHSYGTPHQGAVHDIAAANGIRLWMSENDTPKPGDPENFDGMATPLFFARHVIGDLKHLRPSAWVFWQAVETFSALDGRAGSNWGLIKADLRAGPRDDHRITITRKYWAMAQFSRYIRPGDRLLAFADADTAGSIAPDGKRIVLVHVNSRAVPIALMRPTGWSSAMIVTDRTHNAACVGGNIAPPESISTIVLFKDASRNPCH